MSNAVITTHGRRVRVLGLHLWSPDDPSGRTFHEFALDGSSEGERYMIGCKVLVDGNKTQILVIRQLKPSEP